LFVFDSLGEISIKTQNTIHKIQTKHK